MNLQSECGSTRWPRVRFRKLGTITTTQHRISATARFCIRNTGKRYVSHWGLNEIRNIFSKYKVRKKIWKWWSYIYFVDGYRSKTIVSSKFVCHHFIKNETFIITSLINKSVKNSKIPRHVLFCTWFKRPAASEQPPLNSSRPKLPCEPGGSRIKWSLLWQRSSTRLHFLKDNLILY